MTATATKVQLFDTQPCGRCGGSGHYSFNQIDGDRCYGCGGSGYVTVPKHRKMRQEWVEAVRKVKEPTVGDLAPGDQIAQDKKWVTVESIAVDKSHEMGRIKIGDDEWKDVAWAAVITFSDGSTRNTSTNALVRRRATTDAILARVSEKTAAHVRARREAAS